MAKTTETESAIAFSKEDILKSAKFRNRRDLLGALLEEGADYSYAEVDKLLADFMKVVVKGKVK